MTEIQWLLDILLNVDLPPKLKKRFLARIGDVEANLSTSPQQVLRGTSVRGPAIEAQVGPAIPKVVVPKVIEVDQGNGTSIRGPRKF